MNPRRAPTPSLRTAKAFTLIELMVSIVILTILVVMFSQSLGSITTAWNRAQGKMDNFGKARAALNRLQIDLQNLVDRDDLPNFGEKSGSSALGFYTLQRGFDPSATKSRALSYVEYAVGEEDVDGHSLPVLVRNSQSYSYDTGDSPKFLPAPTPTPAASATPAVPTPFDIGTDDGSLQPGDNSTAKVAALRGLLAFSFGFLHANGKYSSSYYEDSDKRRSRAVAVTVGLVVADDRALRNLESAGYLDDLIGQLSEAKPSGQNWSPKTIWDYQLGISLDAPTGSISSATIDGIPAPFVDSVRCFERTYPLSS